MIGKFLWVALGGAVGSVLRLGIAMIVSHRLPFSTLIVNFVGSLLIGVLIRNVEPAGAIYYFGVVGLCGGFTTFSTFSLDVMRMFRSGETTIALLYIMVSVVICTTAVLIGTKIKI